MVEPVHQKKRDTTQALQDNAQVQQLESALAEFESTRPEWLHRFSLWVGSLQQKYANHPVGRFVLKNLTTRFAAWLIVRFKFLDIGKTRADSAPALVQDWLKLAKFFHAPVHIEDAAPHQVVVAHRSCTMGFKPGQGKLCRASMNMDVEIVRRLGGKMTVEYSLAEGANYCRHLIEFPAHKEVTKS